MLHLKIKPFIVGAKDWSGEVGRNGIRDGFQIITDEVACHKYDDNTHYLLESDEFTLGALSVTYLSILDYLTLSHSN